MTTFVGAAGYEAASGAIPAHAAGDLIIIYASGGTEPSLPVGFTQAGSTASIGSRVDKIGYKVAASGAETSGTWTNADRMQIAVYRSTSGTLSIGDVQFLYNGFANTVNYPALTLTDTSGASWVAGFYHTGSNNWDTTGVEASGTVTRNNTNGVDSSGTVDTNGGVASFSAVSSGAQPNTTNANAAAIEIVETAAPSNTTINVDIPADIDLEWGTTHELAVTHDGGTTTLSGVTLSAPTGWETVSFSTIPDTGTTESFYEYSQSDATVGNFTAQVGDTLAFTSSTGLTIDGSSIPVVDPAATVTGSYKWWDASLSTWTPVSSYTITNLGVFGGSDTTVMIQEMISDMISEMVN